DLIRCDLSQVSTKAEYLRLLGEYADANADKEWILGGGRPMSAFPGGTPRAEDLDTVVSDRHAFLPNRDGLGAWVNSRALELAGTDPTSPVRADGRFVRDSDGIPTRTMHARAMTPVNLLLQVNSSASYLRALLGGPYYVNWLAISAWLHGIRCSYGEA